MRQKTVRHLSSIVIILILTGGCGNSNERSEDRSSVWNLNLKKVNEFTIGGEDIALDRVRNIPVVNHDESLMAWVNSDKNEIIITDPQGNLVGRFGKKGRGSKEFINISSIGFDRNDSILIYDSSQDFLKKFSIDGELLEIEKGLLKDQLWIRSHRIIFLTTVCL